MSEKKAKESVNIERLKLDKATLRERVTIKKIKQSLSHRECNIGWDG